MMGEFAVKLALSAGSTAGCAMGGKGAGLRRGSTNHYLFGVQTNNEMDATHYSFVVHTTIGL